MFDNQTWVTLFLMQSAGILLPSHSSLIMIKCLSCCFNVRFTQAFSSSFNKFNKALKDFFSFGFFHSSWFFLCPVYTASHSFLFPSVTPLPPLVLCSYDLSFLSGFLFSLHLIFFLAVSLLPSIQNMDAFWILSSRAWWYEIENNNAVRTSRNLRSPPAKYSFCEPTKFL